MALFLTGKGRRAASFGNKIDTNRANDSLERNLPEEKTREHDKVRNAKHRFRFDLLAQISIRFIAIELFAMNDWKSWEFTQSKGTGGDA